MQIFDFFSRDEMRAAPADPQEAFSRLVELSYQRLTDRLRDLDPDNQWEEINEARFGFTNVVLGLAKTYGIEPLASMDVPAIGRFGNDEYRQFKADLDHYLVQLVGRQVREEREDSVGLAPSTKERIRTYLHHIKVYIDQADVSDSKRTSLHAKLAEFEAALEENRLPLAKVMKFIMGLGLSGLALADSQTLHRLLDGLIETVAEVHAIEGEQRRLPTPEPVVALLPPRPAKPKPSFRETFSADLDDEIPF